MRNRNEANHRSPQDVPPVSRPRGAAWRSLQADGVVWEGQVLLVGDDVDLAARMVVTHRRVVFVRGGDLVLDIPRDWLRPEPILRRDGVLELFVATPGSNLFDEPLTVPLRMREGHPAAGHIIAMLAPGGVRRILPDALSGMERAREASPAPRFGGFWDDLDGQANAPESSLIATDATANGTEQRGDSQSWAPIEPPDRVLRVPSTPPRQANLTYPITGLRPRDQRRSHWGWIIRLSALTFLLATAAALGAGKLQLPPQGSGRQPILAVPTPTIVATESPPESPGAALSPSDQTAVAMGVGGPAAQSTAAAATAEATDGAETPPAAEAATSAPAVASPPAAIPTPAPAATPPTTAPAAASPAAELTVEAPQPVASTPLAQVTQPAAVSADASAAQEIVVGPLRLAFGTALRAESLPRYGLPPGSGEWVLLRVDVANEGDAAAALNMSDFRLFDRGTGSVTDLDAGTDVIATLAGLEPARAPTETIELEPAANTEALLLFLLAPGSSDDLALIVAQTSIDLAPALALGEAEPGEAPELVEATVTDVLDGDSIVVDIAGVPQTVHFLGMEAPTADACYAADATAANVALVGGQQVWLERQATDRDGENALRRDVWITGADGNRALVAARLVEAGAAVAVPTAPDTRYEAWLAAAAALARTNSAGLWAACQEAAATNADAPPHAFFKVDWRDLMAYRIH